MWYLLHVYMYTILCCFRESCMLVCHETILRWGHSLQKSTQCSVFHSHIARSVVKKRQKLAVTHTSYDSVCWCLVYYSYSYPVQIGTTWKHCRVTGTTFGQQSCVLFFSGHFLSTVNSTQFHHQPCVKQHPAIHCPSSSPSSVMIWTQIPHLSSSRVTTVFNRI